MRVLQPDPHYLAHEVHVAERSVGIREATGANPVAGSIHAGLTEQQRYQPSKLRRRVQLPWPAPPRWGSSSRGTPGLYPGCCGCKSRTQLHADEADAVRRVLPTHVQASATLVVRSISERGRVAQSAEHQLDTLEVVGAEPTTATTHGDRARAQARLAREPWRERYPLSPPLLGVRTRVQPGLAVQV